MDVIGNTVTEENQEMTEELVPSVEEELAEQGEPVEAPRPRPRVRQKTKPRVEPPFVPNRLEEVRTELEVRKLMAEGFGRKMNIVREGVAVANLEMDGSYGIQNTKIRYLTLEKMKAALAPLLAKAGLDLAIEFDDPIWDNETVMEMDPKGNMHERLKTRHVVVFADITLIDHETGYSTTDRVFGEASDGADKALRKATSYAMKTWLANKFLLADGMDASSEVPTDVPFRRKTPEEVEEVKSKLAAGAAPARKERPVPKAVPKEPEQTAPEEPPKAPEAPSAPPTPPEPPEPPRKMVKPETDVEFAEGFKPNTPQRKAVLSLLSKATPEEEAAIREECRAVANGGALMALIQKHME